MITDLLQQSLSLNLQDFFMIILIFALAGFISGLSGFGFSAVGVAVLWFMSPTKAIPLLMALSTTNQLLSVSQLKNDMVPFSQWWSDGPATHILGGLFGIPFGLWIMANLPASELTFVTGIVLLIYSIWMIFKPHTVGITQSGAMEHILVGALGGIIGGFTAFPGCAVVVWAGMRNLTKTEQRAIVQPYILVMQFAALISMVFFRSGDLNSNPFDGHFWMMYFILIPVVLPMTHMGVKAFKRVSDINFKNITLGVLAFSGGGLVYKSLATVVLFMSAAMLVK